MVPTLTGKMRKLFQSGKSLGILNRLEKLLGKCGNFTQNAGKNGDILGSFYLYFSLNFGSFGNEPMQSCFVRHCHRCPWCLCTALPVTGLIIEASYLTNICSYAPSICT